MLLVAAVGAAALLLVPSAFAKEVTGRITSLTDGSITVHGLTCGFAPAGPRPRGVRVGDIVLVSCPTGEDRDAGEPTYVLGAISGKGGKPGPGTFSYTRNGMQVVEGVVSSTLTGLRTANAVTVRPVNGGASVRCSWPGDVPGVPLGGPTLYRIACKGGAFAGIDRATNLDGSFVDYSGAVAAAQPSLRLALRFGGTASCGYGELSPDPSDFTPGAQADIVCDHGAISDLPFLQRPDLTWFDGLPLGADGDRVTFVVGGSYRHTTCTFPGLNPDALPSLGGWQLCPGGTHADPPLDFTYPDGWVTAISDTSLTMRTVHGLTRTVRVWSKLHVSVDYTDLPAGTRAADIVHVGDFVHTQTSNAGPSLNDVVALGVQKLSKGCNYPARFCANAP